MTGNAATSRTIPTKPRTWKSLGINLYLYAAVVLVLFLGIIQGAQAAGMWSTSGKVTASGEKITATGTDPAEIKGWMTISEVMSAYKMTKDEFYTGVGLPADLPETTAFKDIEKLVEGFSTENVRTFLTTKLAK